MDILYGYYSESAVHSGYCTTSYPYYGADGKKEEVTYVSPNPNAIQDGHYNWTDARCVGVVFREPIVLYTKRDDDAFAAIEQLLLNTVSELLNPPLYIFEYEDEDEDDYCDCEDCCQDDYYYGDIPPSYDYEGPSEFNNANDFPIKKDLDYKPPEDYIKDIDRDELYRNNKSYFNKDYFKPLDEYKNW